MNFASGLSSLHGQIRDKKSDLLIVNGALSKLDGLTRSSSNLEEDFSSLLNHLMSAYSVTSSVTQVSSVTRIVDDIDFTKRKLLSAKDQLEREIGNLESEERALMAREAQWNLDSVK